ncbi:venom serine protease Bi-VSP-like [Prorops nasuta]|uniref:venom serine protease Bi-VSP-like n=1 Tax=Prorops nasuta TaxID=863751 RepID=UPI0034CF767F
MWPIAFFLILSAWQFPLHLTRAQDFSSCQVPNGGGPGTCMNIKQCKLVLNIVRTRGHSAADFLRSLVCGYEGNDPLVCCPRLSNTEENDFEDDRAGKNGWNGSYYGPLMPPNCGYSDNEHGRVVGGVPAELGAWPWIAALGYRNTRNPQQPKWLCGGTLISSRHVITAAHCVYRRNDLYVVRLGDLDLASNNDGAQPIDILIEKKIPHPQYNPTTIVNDVAILRLQQEVPFSRNLHPICLPVTEEMRTRSLVRTFPFIAGWGAKSFNGPSSSRLLEAQIPVVDMQECKEAFKSFKNTVIDERVICAGFRQGGKDACQGDSGGPLMAPRGQTFYLLGVVSYGFRCAEPGFPGVYSNVLSFLEFIIKHLI